MGRIAAVRLLMICSEGLLCVFLATWLLSQWMSEEEDLRKDLAIKYERVERQLTDSVIKVKVVRPFIKRGEPSSGPMRLMLNADKDIKLPNGEHLTPTMQVRKSIVHIGGDSIVQEYSDTSLMNVVEGVQVFIHSLIPDSLQHAIGGLDTVKARKLFEQATSSDGASFKLRWRPAGSAELPNTILLQAGRFQQKPALEVSSYRLCLLQRIVPQILFAFALLTITAFAFLLAWRSLQQERRLSFMRNSLVSNMSHELKTPVTTVKVTLEALGDEDVLRDGNTVREYVEIATQELLRLELLVNQTLHTSMMETGKLSIQKSQVELRRLLEELIRSLQVRTEKERAQITESYQGADFTLSADKLHVQGVFLNILDNALKYGGEGVRIKVEGKASAGDIELSISDNGPGIPKAYQQQVFEKFFRVPTGHIHDVKGYGLGLSYAAEVMRLHGGAIRLINNQEGGSTFIIQFPKG